MRLDELGGDRRTGDCQALRLVLRGRIACARWSTEQIDEIGLASLSVATLTAIFSSMVMSVQFAVQMGRFGAKAWVGNVVALSLVRELGPVLTARMVGGRVGAGILQRPSIGSMNVTEQVDALRSMGADPVEVAGGARGFLAAILVLPLLTAFADALGIVGSMLITLADVRHQASSLLLPARWCRRWVSTTTPGAW